MTKQMTMDNLKTKLQERQCKMTPQRQVVLQVFFEHSEKHLSAEDVHSLLKDKAVEIGLATVYRSLELLSEIDLLQKIDFGDGRTRYELNNNGDKCHQHHHLICTKCGVVKEFADDLLEPLERHIAEQLSFKVIDHQVKFFGYCQECQTKGED